MKRLNLLILILIIPIGLIAAPRYVLKADKELVEASLDSAIAQIGVVETGDNAGYMVEQYLWSVGLRKGYPYCAAGEYWAFWVSAIALNLPSSAIPVYKTGSTALMYNKAKAKGYLSRDPPQKGDLIFWKYPDKAQGHVERIFELLRAGWVRTVGFNTTSGKGNQRDGGGVFARLRNVRHPLGRMLIRGYIGFEKV